MWQRLKWRGLRKDQRVLASAPYPCQPAKPYGTRNDAMRPIPANLGDAHSATGSSRSHDCLEPDRSITESLNIPLTIM